MQLLAGRLRPEAPSSTSPRRSGRGLRGLGGGYGASKAAPSTTSVAAAEHPRLRVYAFDLGDMAIDMHQRAFPRGHRRPAGARDRGAGADAAGAWRPAGGRYRAADLEPGARDRRRAPPGAAGPPGGLLRDPAGGGGGRAARAAWVPRDGVRLLVARADAVTHARFSDLPDHLDLGPAGREHRRPPCRRRLRRRLGGRAPRRCPRRHGARRGRRGGAPGDGAGPAADAPEASAFGWRTVGACGCSSPTRTRRSLGAGCGGPVRARPSTCAGTARHGRPIAYGHLAGRFPLSDYQTVYAEAPGSAEMASAGRPFTAQLLVRLMARGVTVAPVVLHAGVSSPERLSRRFRAVHAGRHGAFGPRRRRRPPGRGCRHHGHACLSRARPARTASCAAEGWTAWRSAPTGRRGS